MDTQIILKGILNTVTRVSPIALYMGCVVSGLVFEDQKALILLGGFFLVEMISFFYNMNTPLNTRCALFKSGEKHFSMPGPIPTVIGFFAGFLICEMFEKEKFNPLRFFTLGIFLLIVIWSRINVGCHTIIESLFAGIIGIVIGVAYYYLVKESYSNSKNSLNNEDNDDNENKELGDLLFN